MSNRLSLAVVGCLLGTMTLGARSLPAEPPSKVETPNHSNPSRETSDKVAPEKGLQVGNLVPVSSMRYLETDRNGCYAGQFAKFRAISIYVRSVDEPGLGDLARLVDARLQENEQLRGYIVLLKGSQSDEGLKARLRAWKQEQKLSQIKLAIANGVKTYGIDDATGLQVVDSDQRTVKFSRAFRSGKFDEAGLKQIADALRR